MSIKVEERNELHQNIEQLKSLRRHLELYKIDDPNWIYDINAINYAIRKLSDRYE